MMENQQPEKPDDQHEYVWDDENQKWVRVISCVIEVSGVSAELFTLG
jgi:hypothetical protein